MSGSNLSNRKITLVLGAGASASMGYPLGSDLRAEILSSDKNHLTELILSSAPSESLRSLEEFVETFKKSQMESIDAFLARRPELSTIGKTVIATLLLEKEKEDQLHSHNHSDKWHQYFFNRITSTKWEDVDLSRISIITFNYDRSLEQYMLMTLKNSFNKNNDEAISKINKMKIIHVYGSLGATLPSNSEYIPYGECCFEEGIRRAAQSIQVIPEGRDDSPALQQAREALSEADRIGFMGFGYDKQNLERLHSERTCRKIMARSDGNHTRMIVGTCIGMTKAEKGIAMKRTAKWDGHNSLEQTFFDSNCLQFLRETLILGA